MASTHISPLPEYREGGWLTKEQYDALARARRNAIYFTDRETETRRRYEAARADAVKTRTHYENLLEESAGQLSIDSVIEPQEGAT